MANVNLLSPSILHWEGGFVNDPTDRGGATNMGVTFVTFQAVFGHDKTVDDLKAMTKEMFAMVLKKFYWDRWRADEIINQSVANILVDWVWASGKWGIVIPQRIVKVMDDGIVGDKTIEALNAMDQAFLHTRIKESRMSFISSLVLHHPEQVKFEKGWRNRVNSYVYEP